MRIGKEVLPLLVLVQFTCLSCTPRAKQQDTGSSSAEVVRMNEAANADSVTTVIVAMIDIYDLKTWETARSELKDRGVVCYIEGSVHYSVSVAQQNAAQAREILRNSKRLDHERVHVIEADSCGKAGQP
jgi:hypothetical protein